MKKIACNFGVIIAILCTCSITQGQINWGTPSAIQVASPHLSTRPGAAANGSTVLLAYTNFSDFKAMIAKSTDGGETFTTTSQVVVDGQPLVASPQITYGHGKFVLGWMASTTSIRVSRSYDNGVTWSSSVLISHDDYMDELSGFSIASGPGASFGVACQSFIYDSTLSRVSASIDEADPVLLGPDYYTDPLCKEITSPNICADANGAYVVVMNMADQCCDPNVCGTLVIAQKYENGKWLPHNDLPPGNQPLISAGPGPRYVCALPQLTDINTVFLNSDLTLSEPSSNLHLDNYYPIFPSITTNNQNDWVITYRGYDPDGAVDAEIFYSFSSDGQTFTTPVPLNSDYASDGRRDDTPVIVATTPGKWACIWREDYEYGGFMTTTGSSAAAFSTDPYSGASFSGALKEGQAYACGFNTYGPLAGDNMSPAVAMSSSVALANVFTPLTTGTPTNITKMLSGGFNTYCIADGGANRLYAAGYNNYGQCGDGTAINRNNLVAAKTSTGSPLTSVTAVAGGLYNTAVIIDGKVYVWAFPWNGIMGDGTTLARSGPILNDSHCVLNSYTDAPLTNVISISLGGYHGIALTSDYKVWTWGYNVSGQIGNGNNTSQFKAVKPQFGGSDLTLSAGSAAEAGVNWSGAFDKATGFVYTWGENEWGQLGQNNNVDSNVPLRVDADSAGNPLSGVTQFVAGAYTGLALTSSGLKAWGRDDWGQCSQGATVANASGGRKLPVTVKANSTTDFSGIYRVELARTADHYFVRKMDGTVWGWGGNHYGQLGDNTNNNVKLYPIQIALP